MLRFLNFVLFALLVALAAVTVRARPAVPAADGEAQHALARALVAEADWHQPDYAPIAWVLHKRWQLHNRNRQPVGFAQFITMYSALYKPERTSRKRAILALPWGPSDADWGGKRWDRVRAWVEKWSDGEVRDPCPKAMQWGGTMDRPHGHWYPVSCGRTRNIFYGSRR